MSPKKIVFALVAAAGAAVTTFIASIVTDEYWDD